MQTKLIKVKVYCIDSSSLINLKRYPEDIFPTIWKKLNDLVKENQLKSPIEVYDELERKNNELERREDDLLKWCKNRKSMFADLDEEQQKRLESVKKQYEKQHWDAKVQKTGPWADPWVIALAMSIKGVVVSDESKEGRNKIPDICGRLNVKCISTFEFFRELGVKY